MAFFEITRPARSLDPQSQQASGELYWDDGESLLNEEQVENSAYYHFNYSLVVSPDHGEIEIKLTLIPKASNLPLFLTAARSINKNISFLDSAYAADDG